jgi:hypothetical protein
VRWDEDSEDVVGQIEIGVFVLDQQLFATGNVRLKYHLGSWSHLPKKLQSKN